MPKTTYISITPNGFLVNGTAEKTLEFRVEKESWARKLWQAASGRRVLACFSSNGISSKDGKDCKRCFDRECCLLKRRIFFKLDGECFCLELPGTSFENFALYSRKLKSSGNNVKTETTIAWVIGRGYWGEVCFARKTT